MTRNLLQRHRDYGEDRFIPERQIQMSCLVIRIFTFYILLSLLGAFLISPFSASSDQIEKTAPEKLTTHPSMGRSQPAALNHIPVFGYRIVNVYPHDPEAFTQGLVFVDGYLFEGTGIQGRSSLRKVDLVTGNIIQIRKLPPRFFGEGIAVYRKKVIQLTWRANLGFVYDKDTFQLLGTFNYPTEGWGVTYDGNRLIMSDGTSTLHILHPDTYKEIGRIDVHDRNGSVSRLNELEYIRGLIYANVWKTDRIAKISPETGEVVGWIDLSDLLRSEYRVQEVDVLNGIAYDEKHDRLFVTGKLWPKLFEIKLTVQKNR